MVMYKRRNNRVYSRKSYGKSRSSSKRSKTSLWRKATLAKFVRAEVQKVLKNTGGPPRSLNLRMFPMKIRRTGGNLTASPTTNNEWKIFIQGRDVDDRYVLLPVSEAIPPRLANNDGRFRSSEKILIKGVSLRMTISQVEGLRVQAFVFPNTLRCGETVVPTGLNRPWGDKEC